MEDGGENGEKRDDEKRDGEKHKKQRSNLNGNNLALAAFCISGVLALIMNHVGYPRMCILDMVSYNTHRLVNIADCNPHRHAYTYLQLNAFSGPERSDTCPAFEALHTNAIVAAICDHFPIETLGITLKGVNPAFARHLQDISCEDVNRAALLRWVQNSRPFHYYEMLNIMEDDEVVEWLLEHGLFRESYDMRNFLFTELWNPQFLCESHIRTLIRHDLDNLAKWMRSAPYDIRIRWMHGLWDLPEDLAAFCAVVRGRMHGLNYLYLIYDDLRPGDSRRTTDSMTYFLREVYNLEDWRLVDIVFERFWEHRVFQQCAIKAWRDLKYRRTKFIFIVEVLIQVHFLLVHLQNMENKKNK